MNDAEEDIPIVPPEPGEVGLVEPHDFVHAQPFTFESGQVLPGFTLRYETYGRLNAARDNTVVICHALSGDHHCAGIHALTDAKPGWWNNFIGPGKAIDTNQFFVLCANVLGGCQGSSGPSSTDPRTGRPFGLAFPFVTIRDMVHAQKLLCDHLGLASLAAVIGGSMGGMLVLQWGIEYPAFVRRLIPLATTARESAQAIAFNEVGRQAIMADPNWQGGDYDGKAGPLAGLAIARMIGHITYLSDEQMHAKFARRLQDRERFGYGFATEFEVESYLRYQGDSFVRRFDANSYLYITKSMDYFDLPARYGSLVEAFENVRAEFLVVSISSDWLFPTYQSKETVKALKANGIPTTFVELDSPHGHDAFFLPNKRLSATLAGFLANVLERRRKASGAGGDRP
jgi:homoserine O-acetyltransferase